MRKKLSSYILGTLLLGSLVVPAVLLTAPHQAKAINLWGDTFDTEVGYESFNAIGMGKRDPRAIAASVINILLGLLGVIAVILILFGGFKWMTAAGNEDRVTDARKILIAGIVGLLIVLSAYAVSIYIIRSFLQGTGADISTGDIKYQLENTVE